MTERADDWSSLAASCIVCGAAWSWDREADDLDPPDRAHGWRCVVPRLPLSAYGPNEQARRDALAPFLGSPPGPPRDHAIASTELEKAIEVCRKELTPDTTERLGHVFDESTVWVIGLPQTAEDSEGELCAPTRDYFGKRDAFLVLFTREIWLHYALYAHSSWFLNQVPMQLSGRSIFDEMLDVKMSMWINMDLPFEFVIPADDGAS